MSMSANDALRLDDLTDVTWLELVGASGLPEGELRELVQYGAVVPRDPGAPAWTFEARWIKVVRDAGRLRQDFELDPHSVSVLLCYIERIENLEAEVRRLRAQLG
jgi:hypothetical protein